MIFGTLQTTPIFQENKNTTNLKQIRQNEKIVHLPQKSYQQLALVDYCSLHNIWYQTTLKIIYIKNKIYF